MRVIESAESVRSDIRFGAGVIAALTGEAAFIGMVTAVTIARGMDP